MAPLNEPLPGDPVDEDPVEREPWERIFDLILLAAAAVLAWNALVVFKIVPGSTLIIGTAWITGQPDPEHLWVLGGTAVLAIIQYPVMLHAATRGLGRVTREDVQNRLKRVLLQEQFSVTTWAYVLVLYFMGKQIYTG